MKKTIIVSIPVGRSVKYFLNTPLYDLLLKQYAIALFSSAYSSRNFIADFGGNEVQFFNHPGISGKTLRGILVRLIDKFRMICSDFRLSDRHVGKINLQTKKQMYGFSYYVFKFLYYILRYIGGWEKIKSLVQKLYLVPYYENLFQKLSPAMVISTSPFKVIPDYCLQACAKKNNVPLVFFPSSWDNLTRTGEILFEPTKIFSWGKEMSRHAREFFGIKDEQIVDAGMIRLESRLNNKITRDEFLRIMNIPFDHKIILFPANQYYIMAPEPRILQELIDDVKSGIFGKVILILRPNNTWDAQQKKYIETYKNDPVVRINIPEDDSSPQNYKSAQLSWNIVLENCDIVITICSMIVLEAFYFGKPVININYDYGVMNEYGHSFKLYYEREVYKKVIETKSTFFVNNREQMRQAIKSYLADPSLHKNNRKELLSFWDVELVLPNGRCELAFKTIEQMIDK